MKEFCSYNEENEWKNENKGFFLRHLQLRKVLERQEGYIDQIQTRLNSKQSIF